MCPALLIVIAKMLWKHKVKILALLASHSIRLTQIVQVGKPFMFSYKIPCILVQTQNFPQILIYSYWYNIPLALR